jgi:hypothetical protein
MNMNWNAQDLTRQNFAGFRENGDIFRFDFAP